MSWKLGNGSFFGGLFVVVTTCVAIFDDVFGMWYSISTPKSGPETSVAPSHAGSVDAMDFWAIPPVIQASALFFDH